MKKLLCLLGALSLFTVASTSMAQPAGTDDERCDAAGGYCYKFLDDILNDKGLDSTAPLIHVRPGGVRTMLIRPRTQFVPEMLKSVENI